MIGENIPKTEETIDNDEREKECLILSG